MGKIAAMKTEILGRLFKRPVTDKFPAKPAKIVDGWRGKIDFDYNVCIMCGLCAKVCPAEAIEMKPVSDKKKAPLFYQDRCVYCGQCAETCPKKCIHLTKVYDTASGNRKTMRVDHIAEKTEQVKAEDSAKAAGQGAAKPAEATTSAQPADGVRKDAGADPAKKPSSLNEATPPAPPPGQK